LETIKSWKLLKDILFYQTTIDKFHGFN